MKPTSSNSTKGQISEKNLILVSNTALGFVKHAVNSFQEAQST